MKRGNPASRRCPYDVVHVGFLLGHGGDALQMLSLANEASRAGARVKVVVPLHEESESLELRCDALGIDCERTSLLRAGMHGAKQNLRSLIDLFRSWDAPVVHFHTGNSYLPRAAMIALSVVRRKGSLVTIHSPYETVQPGSWRARFWAFMAARRMVAVVSPSHHGTQFQRACGLPENRLATINNGVDIAQFSSGDATVARLALGISDSVPIVLFCSRIDEQKRPVDAVRIFADATQDAPNSVLLFVGSGDLEAQVLTTANELGVADRVKFVGYQINIPDWLAASTVWLLPTARENFSVALLEALAAGCCILTTACPGNTEVLVTEVNGVLFDVGDTAAATRQLHRLLGDSDLRAALAQEARRTASRFGSDRTLARYFDIYRRIDAFAEHFPAVHTKSRCE